MYIGKKSILFMQYSKIIIIICRLCATYIIQKI